MTKSGFKTPSIEGLRRAQRQLKETYKKKPSPELVDIVGKIGAQEKVKQSEPSPIKNKIAAKKDDQSTE